MIALQQTGSSVRMRRPRFSVFGIIADGSHGGVLLVRQRRGARSWTLPDGKVRGSETLREALQREVWEETGLTVEPSGLVAMLEWPALRKTKVYFHCQARAPAPLGPECRNEIMAVAYFSAERMPPSCSPALRAVASRMPNWAHAGSVPFDVIKQEAQTSI